MGFFLWGTLVSKEKKPNPRKRRREEIVQKAYEKVSARLEKDAEASKAIDDLVKLLKADKDLGDEQSDVREIDIRWEKSEKESSNEA